MEEIIANCPKCGVEIEVGTYNVMGNPEIHSEIPIECECGALLQVDWEIYLKEITEEE